MSHDSMHQIKHVADVVSVALVSASWLPSLPTIVAVLANGATFLWLAIRIWESETVQRWWTAWRARRGS